MSAAAIIISTYAKPHSPGNVRPCGRVRDPIDAERTIDDASHLTFGEYVRLLQELQAREKLCRFLKMPDDELESVIENGNDA